MNRRDFLKAVGVGAIAAGLLDCARAQEGVAQGTAKRPNIVIIMADDMGFSDIGCYGSEIQTPNLDALAAGGLRFRQFYNTARCCPTRASLLTGLYSHRAGIGHMTADYGKPGYVGRLNENCLTIAEVLGTAGYTSYAVGKWHVGDAPEVWPCKRGFARYYGAVSATGHYFGLQKAPGRKFLMDDTEVPPEGEPRMVGQAAYYPFKNADGSAWYGTDAYTDYAIKYVDEHVKEKDNPFFLYVAYTAPHWPLHALPEDIAKYKGKYMKGWDALRAARHARMKKMGIVDADWPLTPRDEAVTAWEAVDAEKKEEMDLRMAVYAAMIDRMDQNIGRIVESLKKNGVLEDTLILFLADNGGCAEGGPWGFSRNEEPTGTPDSYASYGTSWANASNTPFRLYKHWVHEGGIATPLIVHWPRVIKERGALTDQVGHVIDLAATCYDVGGATYPATYHGREIATLDGRSLAPIFRRGKREGHEAVFWEHEGNRAVRRGDWKLVSKHPGQWELYDLKSDRTEVVDLAEKRPDIVKDLKELYRQWAARSQVVPWAQARKRI
ncbi:MAG: arylsulfatase [Phycisphaerae bacterium]|nr:arylsulfatase [Phycisphaerae bacterium]